MAVRVRGIKSRRGEAFLGSNVRGGVPEPGFRCPAMDMIQVRKIGPEPNMAKDGSMFDPDSRDKEIVKDEIVNVANLFVQRTGNRATDFPPTFVPSVSVFPSLPERVPYKPASKHFFSCPDPRLQYAGMFTPGGDLGEFLLTLTALERVQNQELKAGENRVRFGQQEVGFYLHSYLEYMSSHGKHQFAGCTDVEALQKLAEAAQVLDALEPLNRREYARILSLTASPEYVGSRFFQDAIQDPTGYATRAELAESVLRAFVRIRLDKTDPMHDRVLYVPAPKREYKPTAFVEVVRMACPRDDKSDQEFSLCNLYPCHDLVPLVVPNTIVDTPTDATKKVHPGDVREAVIVHRDDVKLYRAELAEWAYGLLRTTGTTQPTITKGNILQEMLELGDVQLERFKSKLFQTIGQYEASYLTNEVDSVQKARLEQKERTLAHSNAGSNARVQGVVDSADSE
jgi:hypothetical protein